MNHLKSYELFEAMRDEDAAISWFNASGPLKIRDRWHIYAGNIEIGEAFIYIDSSGRIKIDSLDINKERRGEGFATKFMEQISKMADDNGLVATLTPDSYRGSSKSRLEEFYSRFGFVKNKGRNKDYSISELMYRKPQTK